MSKPKIESVNGKTCEAFNVYCGNCNRMIVYWRRMREWKSDHAKTRAMNDFRYCQHCGEKIDWSDEL